ncbi:MAG: YicC family protein [Firmicutes bacterium]|nr:YicC family protein [Bacillota bacterium]
MKSMTGFGRGECEKLGRQFTVEIKTVNHRYLEPNIRMPHQFQALEASIRAIMKERIARGKADVSIRYTNHSDDQGTVWVNETKLSEYVSALRKAAENVGLTDDLALSKVLNLPGVVESEMAEEDLEEIKVILTEALDLAINDLDAMRLREGETLKLDFKSKLDELEEHVVEIEKIAPRVVEGYKTRLYERMDQYLDKAKTQQLDEGRLETEVTLFADRCCIDEELTRLHSHIKQYRQLIEKKEPIGRQLDFLTQELNRESNTIASKSNDLEITRHALAMKNIVEKIREQIQNIE